jgi:tRNA A-37 threonylcarbamoyl transferase component Bud32
MQTNSELWLDTTLRIGACGTWWAAGTPGGQTLGTLQLDPDLVAAPAVRDRVAAAVAAVRAANPPGVLRTTELVYDAKRAWLVVATLPKPTLADLLASASTLPPGAAAGLAVDIAAALRQLHAAGLAHGDLSAGAVVLTGAGCAVLAEVGVLAAVRDAATDVGADGAAWADLVRDLASRTGSPESQLLARAAAAADAGDLTAAARLLALAATDLPDFETRDGLAALVPTLAPAPHIPSQRRPSTMDSGRPVVSLRLGPGVPDWALLNPTSVAQGKTSRPRRRVGRLLAWLAPSLMVVLAGAAAAWWLLLR